jgi:hypothetical protein
MLSSHGSALLDSVAVPGCNHAAGDCCHCHCLWETGDGYRTGNIGACANNECCAQRVVQRGCAVDVTQYRDDENKGQPYNAPVPTAVQNCTVQYCMYISRPTEASIPTGATATLVPKARVSSRPLPAA